MALGTIDEMVKNRLSFLPDSDPTWDASIESFKCESMYYLNSFLLKDAADVEDETKWVGIEKILLADYTAFQLSMKKIIENVGGQDGDSVGSGSKLLTKGKAGSAEAEFDYAKSSDGTTFSMRATEIIPELKESICRNARALGFCIPGICPPKGKVQPQPAFAVINQ